MFKEVDPKQIIKTIQHIFIGVIITVTGFLIGQPIYDNYIKDTPKLIATIKVNAFEQPNNLQEIDSNYYLVVRLENKGRQVAKNTKLVSETNIEFGEFTHLGTVTSIHNTQLIEVGDLGPGELATLKLWIPSVRTDESSNSSNINIYSDEKKGTVRYFQLILDRNIFWLRIIQKLNLVFLSVFLIASILIMWKYRMIIKKYENHLKMITKEIEAMTDKLKKAKK